MNTKLIIAGAAVAGAAYLIATLIGKKAALKQMEEPAPLKKSHHLTDVFAQAKSQLS